MNTQHNYMLLENYSKVSFHHYLGERSWARREASQFFEVPLANLASLKMPPNSNIDFNAKIQIFQALG